ncbi:NAD(P)-dependent alcohol dehydrogenase [Campylobacter gastrosuis]|uniref:NAD(P)-dependent alcohol dehydrogenase n=1 Tax=Campylobacter gastrosuis TaxID=2974576 RepID=A0ABT7HRC8_9BACT|nr:NAD(P)-dependent alcohol dehydrogenase [Campylobacter gastrosuis]MDL0089415.1 NAD(P)-dependent alcohol dehydrogenase [Campylobacter gastrosuis]
MNKTRRDFVKNSAILGATLSTFGVSAVFGASDKNGGFDPKNANVKCKGWAAFDSSGVFKPWEFERRPVGDDDILIDIKYASICHSDIHTIKGDWGEQIYPQIPGHEIVGLVSQVGKNVKNFKVGDRVGVGCMVDNKNIALLQKDATTGGLGEQYSNDTIFTYGFSDKRESTGITQGGYSDKIVINAHFAVHIPQNLDFKLAAPLLCAGVTTFSPLMKYKIKKGDKVGVSGIGGLGHMAVKLAVKMGAEVTAFTTSESKKADILSWGAKEVVVVSEPSRDLARFKGVLDYHISTIPVQFDVAPYVSSVKPFGTFTLVGMGENFSITQSNLALSASRVNFTSSLIGDMKETQDVINFCADNKIYPNVEIINASDITNAYKKVQNKEARYRYVIDSASI